MCFGVFTLWIPVADVVEDIKDVGAGMCGGPPVIATDSLPEILFVVNKVVLLVSGEKSSHSTEHK